MNIKNLPTEPPAIGGWYYDEKHQQSRFLMPPYPGVDDTVKTPAGLAYRKLAERDAARRSGLTVLYAFPYDVNHCRGHIVRCMLIDWKSQSVGWGWFTWKLRKATRLHPRWWY